MAERFASDTDRMAEVAELLRGVGGSAQHVGTTLGAVLENAMRHFGGDPAGKQYRESFRTQVDSILRGVGSAGEMIVGTADQVRSVAKQLAAAEDAQVGEMRQLGQAVEGGPATPHGGGPTTGKH